MAGFNFEEEEARREYIDEVIGSEGFYVTSEYGTSMVAGIVRMTESLHLHPKAEDAARFAVEKYNVDNNKNLKFLKILNLNMEPTAGQMYYITLAAKEFPGGGLVNHYQTKVWAKINTGFSVQVFRLAPYAIPTEIGDLNDACWLWIGNLKEWMDENYIYYKCFYDCRELTTVKIMRNQDTGESEGYGFLGFKSHAAAEKSLKARNGKLMPKSANQSYQLNWVVPAAFFSSSDAI